jgi:hypothetical protein
LSNNTWHLVFYETFQNEIRDTFPDTPVPNKLTISCLVNLFHDTGSVQDRNCSGWFLKENMHTSEELKQNTELCISNVTAETLHWVVSNIRKRVNAYITEHGGHFEHLI